MDFDKDTRFAGLKPLSERVWLASPTMHDDEKKYIREAFDTNWVTTAGSNIAAIEAIVAEKLGCAFTVALSSGTSALHLAARLAGEKLYGQPEAGTGALAGKKVFCSDVTFDASVNPVAYEGGKAVFIDTEYDTWNMDPEALRMAFKLYPEVRLIIITHLYGTPAKMEEIREIAAEHDALIIEDAAESLGAGYLIGETRFETGALGDIGAISFNGNKIITGSSGGMLLTGLKEDADKIRKWSTQSREPAPWYQHEELGYNYRMSNIIAGIVRGQLPYLEEHIERKREIYERYRDGLSGLPVSMNPYDEKRSVPNFWLSCMTIHPDAMAHQVRGDLDYTYTTEPGKSSPQEILDALNHFGCEGRPVWKPMHLQPIYRTHPFVTRTGNGRGLKGVTATGTARGGRGLQGATTGAARGFGDVGTDLFERGLCLPSDIKMTPEQQDVVIEVVKRCFG